MHKMKELFEKYKKTGLIITAVLIAAAVLIIYGNSGYMKLNKNNSEDIFADEQAEVLNNTDTAEAAFKNSGNIQQADRKNISSESTAENDTGKKIVVEIKGEVKKPDVYELDSDSIINDLIQQAGGVTENADISSINRAGKLQDHQMIYIADKNNPEDQKKAAETQTQTVITDTPGSLSDSGGKTLINLNTATEDQLKSINGVGSAKAQSIIEYRETSGGFKSVEDLKNVKGIGDKMFDKIKDYVTV